MIVYLEKRHSALPYRIFCALMVVSFLFTSILPLSPSYAQSFSPVISGLPVPGAMVNPSPCFCPPLLKGVILDPDNPLRLDFIIETGEVKMTADELRAETSKLVKYFLAALTVPAEELWVNLSPYEQGRIIPEAFGETEMGRDLLAQDYILKQLTASLVYPESGLGKDFWKRVYQQAQKKFGTTNIPLNTFNKVWIIPEDAVVYERGRSAFVVKSHLKVMLEEDYLALQNNLKNKERGTDQLPENEVKAISGVTSDVVREVLIPEIEKEVNTGKNFAALRQIYNSMILATWYKLNLKESLLGQVYVDQNKTQGVDVEDKTIKQKIYEQYLAAFKQGVYNYIKEDYDPASKQVIPRKYFSGGFGADKLPPLVSARTIKDTGEPLAPQQRAIVEEGMRPASPAAGGTIQAAVDLLEVGGNADAKQLARAREVPPMRQSEEGDQARFLERVGDFHAVAITDRMAAEYVNPEVLRKLTTEEIMVRLTGAVRNAQKYQPQSVPQILAAIANRVWLEGDPAARLAINNLANSDELSSVLDENIVYALYENEMAGRPSLEPGRNEFADIAIKNPSLRAPVIAALNILLKEGRETANERMRKTAEDNLAALGEAVRFQPDTERRPMGRDSAMMSPGGSGLEVQSLTPRVEARERLAEMRTLLGSAEFNKLVSSGGAARRMAVEAAATNLLLEVAGRGGNYKIFGTEFAKKDIMPEYGHEGAWENFWQIVSDRVNGRVASPTVRPRAVSRPSGRTPFSVRGVERISNVHVRDWVNETAGMMGATDVEVVDTADFQRLIDEEMAAGKLFKAEHGNYVARSHPNDVARSEERTMVLTDDENDKGLYNKWKHTDTVLPKIMDRLRWSIRPGEKVYVIPFLMGPAHSPFSKVGIQITNSRYVAIEMISMTRVGQEAWEHLGDSDNFVECIHSSGDMDNLSRSNKEDDDRYFAVVRGRKRADGTYDRSKGIAYGSNYGGNVLMGKKHLALRIASLLGVEEGWLAEHMMLLEIKNKETGEVKRVAGAFPSASGKTNLAMLQPPKELAEKYEVTVVGDDILWLRINEEDGRLYAINPENGLFGVLPGTSRAKNPSFVDAIESETGITIFTNPAYNPETGEVWWEGKTKEFPSLEGDGRFWLDWKGRNILERDKELKRQLQAGEISEAQYKEEKSWAQKNSRGTVPAFSVPNLSPDFNNIKGVPIDLVLWGGRISWALEPLIRFMKSPQHGVFDGATTIVEATFAAEGKEGTVREDPMAQRPFFSYNEMKYFKHWLEIVQKLGDKAPAFAHVNWFRRDAAGNFMWPGFGENLRNLLWALEMKERGPEALVQAGKARETPIGFVPTEQGLDLRGLEETVSRETLGEILSFDPELRKKELVRQINYLNALANDAHPVPPEFIRIANETGEALGLGENMWDKASAQSGGEAMASSPLDSSLETVRVALRTNPMTLSLENVSEWLDDFGPESDDPYNVFERVFRETGDHDLANAMASLAGEIAFSHSPDSEESPFSSEDIIHWLTREEGIAQNRPGRSSHGPLDLPSKTPGGINLDPALLDLQIKRDGNGVPLPLLLQPIDQLNIQGFLPVIINITPVTNLPMLLGMAGKGGAPEKETDHRPASPLIEPKAQNYTADNRKVSLLN